MKENFEIVNDLEFFWYDEVFRFVGNPYDH